MNIRPCTPADYPATCAIHNAVKPEYPMTVEQWHHHDTLRGPVQKFGRWVLEQDGAVVAYGQYSQTVDAFHPQIFYVYAATHPDWQRRGFGAALYDHLVAELAPFDPIMLRTPDVRADMAASLSFVARRGFTESMRAWESRLDVASFDPAPFAAAPAQAAAHGITITTLAALAADPEHRTKLWALDNELSADVPSPDPFTPMAFEEFSKWVFDSPHLIPEAFFVALDGDEYVGMSTLWRIPTSDALSNGLTGVKRSHRRKGIALALKLRGIAFAKSVGAPHIKTWNEANNRAMLSINEALGFVKQPAWISFAKAIKEAV